MGDGHHGVVVVKETISGKFKSPEVANTLWAFATMGTRPREWMRMMGQLERRSVWMETISRESKTVSLFVFLHLVF